MGGEEEKAGSDDEEEEPEEDGKEEGLEDGWIKEKQGLVSAAAAVELGGAHHYLGADREAR